MWEWNMALSDSTEALNIDLKRSNQVKYVMLSNDILQSGNSSLVFTSKNRQTSIANNRKTVRGSPWFTLIKLKNNSFFNCWREFLAQNRHRIVSRNERVHWVQNVDKSRHIGQALEEGELWHAHYPKLWIKRNKQKVLYLTFHLESFSGQKVHDILWKSLQKNVYHNAWRFSKKRKYCDVIGPLALPYCTSGHVQPPLGPWLRLVTWVPVTNNSSSG